MGAYQEQLRRVNRYYSRFTDLTAGMIHAAPSDTYIDDVYAFFQNCYHLKDWLINDPLYTKHTNAEIEAYVTASLALSICADICNASKHLVLNRPPRSGSIPKIERKHIQVNLHDSFGGGPSPPTTIRISIEVEHNGTMHDAFQIAMDALRDWNSFI